MWTRQGCVWQSTFGDVSSWPHCLPGFWSLPPWAFVLQPLFCWEMWASSPVSCLSRPPWAVRGPRPVPGGLWTGTCHVSYLQVLDQLEIPRSDCGWLRSLEPSGQGFSAPAQRTCVKRGCTQQAVGLLGGGLPEPHTDSGLLKCMSPSGSPVVSVASPALPPWLYRFWWGGACRVGPHSCTSEV